MYVCMDVDLLMYVILRFVYTYSMYRYVPFALPPTVLLLGATKDRHVHAAIIQLGQALQ